MEQPEHYKGIAPPGFPVLWWPHGVMDDTAVPYTAFVSQGWTSGVCDLSVLPAQDGAVEIREQVYHAGDLRLRDSYGRLSPGAHARGCWTETTWMSLPKENPTPDKKKATALAR